MNQISTLLFSEGMLPLRYVFEQGEVIEIYPDDNRCLLYAVIDAYNLPVHIVVENTPVVGVVVTAYIPDKGRWIAGKRRQTRRKR